MKSTGSLARIAVVFAKEVQDNLRDRRTLLTALLTPLTGPLTLALVLFLLNRSVAGESDKSLILPIVGGENAPQLVAFLGAQPGIKILSVNENPEEAVRLGHYDAVIRIPANFAKALRSAEPAPVEIVQNTSQQTTLGTVGRIRNLLNGYSRQIGSLRLLARGINPAIVQALAIETVDVASAQGKAGFILGLMPLYIVLAAFIGGLYVAIDTTTGERERGSLEPLVINPIQRWELLAGKLGTTFVFTSVVVLETLAGLALTINFLPVDDLGLKLSLSPATFVGLFLITLPIVLLAGSTLTLIASFTRSFKEAQSYLTPIFLIPTMPSLLVAFLPQQSSWWSALIPIYSQQLLMNQLLKGESLPLGSVLVASGVTVAVGMAVAFAAVRIFEGEEVVSGR
jgi:sodium transport system permease protein